MPPTNQPEEITATFLAERFRFANEATGDVIIGTAWMNGEVCEEIAIKGQADIDELQDGQEYRFYGKWTTYKNKRTGQTEPQFAFQSFVKQAPHGRAGVVAYLQNAGEGFGLGKVRAVKCWELWGSDAVKTLREQPELVSEQLTASGLRLTLDNAKQIAAKLTEEISREACMIDLTGWFAGRGFRKTLPRQLIRDHGNLINLKVRRNPFILTAYPGCGFDNVDRLWFHFGLPANAMKRQVACAVHAVANAPNGSTWMYRKAVEDQITTKIGSGANPTKAIKIAVRAKLLAEEFTDGVNGPISPTGNIGWLAIKRHADDEQLLANLIADAMIEPHFWPDVSEIANIDGEQPKVLAKVLQGSVCVLGGRPGTGKTFTAANTIKTLIEKLGVDQIKVGAPTNLAAQRLSMAMEGYGVTIRARTNHSLLGRPRVRGHEWHHNETNPLPCKIWVCDEESMKDTRMMCAAFRARPKGTMMLLIGDINQLPPVDHGAPLRDIIAAGLPYGELKQIRRNSGGIVEACAAIVEGRPWGPGDNLQIIEVDEESQQLAAAIRSLEECKERGFDPVWDSRIIVAKNETRRAFNKVLQPHLNKNDPIDGSPFRIGDKVINRSTSEFTLIAADLSDEEVEFNKESGTVKVANGELGKVLEVHERHFVIELFAPPRIVKVPRGPMSNAKADSKEDQPAGGKDGDGEQDKTGTGCSFELAYAVTYHSSQGSEFPWAIVVASTRDMYMGYRELVYTGISRAKNKCVLIGLKRVWDRFCKNVALVKRKTLLKERILLARAKDDLANL